MYKPIPMLSKSAYLIICSVFLSLSNCWSQQQPLNDIDYLADHAVFFTNGILTYKENGKYGFVYKNHRLSEAIYDTIYNFGQELCVVKRGAVFNLLDRNLKNTYYQPIQSIEKYYSDQEHAFILKVTNTQGYSREYITDSFSGWSVAGFFQGTTFPLQQDAYLYSRSITDSIDRADQFPEAKGRGEVKVLVNQNTRYHGPYTEVLFCGNMLKFFPQSGMSFVKERPGLSVSDYLGESLIVYRNPEKNEQVIIDEAKEDTLAVSEFNFSSFIQDGQLYLSSVSYAEHGTIDHVNIYNNKGILLHTFTPGMVNGRKNRTWFNGGRISEEIRYIQTGKSGYSVYAIYAAATLERVLNNVTELVSNKTYSFCYSPKNRTYFLLRGGEVIYSVQVSKGNYATLSSLDENNLFEKEPACIRIISKDDRVLESILVSASGKTLRRTNKNTFAFSISSNQDVIQIHEVKRTDDTDKNFGLYSPEKDSVYWFPIKDLEVYALTKDVLHYHNTLESQNYLSNRKGDTLLTFNEQQLSFIRLKNGHFLLTLYNDTIMSVYNDRFQLLCNECDIFPINTTNKIGNNATTLILARKDAQKTFYQLVDEQLNPINPNHYRAVLSGVGNLVALLTENDTIEYWMIGE